MNEVEGPLKFNVGLFAKYVTATVALTAGHTGYGRYRVRTAGGVESREVVAEEIQLWERPYVTGPVG